MVLLTMTRPIVEGLEIRGEVVRRKVSDSEAAAPPLEPSLEAPAIGKPISHGQILDLWKYLSEDGKAKYTLENLLCGAHVYIPPPPPKPEPVSHCSYPHAP